MLILHSNACSLTSPVKARWISWALISISGSRMTAAFVFLLFSDVFNGCPICLVSPLIINILNLCRIHCLVSRSKRAQPTASKSKKVCSAWQPICTAYLAVCAMCYSFFCWALVKREKHSKYQDKKKRLPRRNIASFRANSH